MGIEQRFDVPLIAGMALREKQIQQSYRPIIGVHKWFARRPGTLFRGLLLAEFGKGRLKDLFFESNDFRGIRIADPLMGGGTPLIEANRVGCDVQGLDVNPMSAWIVREEIEHIDLPAYEQAARALVASLRDDVGRYYRTTCPLYGDTDLPVKSFLWVKVLDCGHCGKPFDLFPGYLLAENRRHPKNVLVCPACGDLNEVEDRKSPGSCTTCRTMLRQAGPARRGRCDCPHCGRSNVYPGAVRRPLEHRLFAIEYHNPRRKARHKGRFFKKPDADDLARADAAAGRWKRLTARFVPEQEILPGDETGRLHRWGYLRYRDMFNPRQLLGLESSCRLIAKTRDECIRHATAGLSAAYSRMAAALKPGAPLVFTYHHNKLEAHYAIGVVILDAGLVCSATLPCPAEMGGSIHIHGTASSIIDTVFVCRRSGAAPIRWMFDTPDQLATITEEDSALLATTGRSPTRGDTRCIVFGHLTRMAVWKLRKSWDRVLPVKKKITAFADAVSAYGDPDRIAEYVVAAHRNRTTARMSS